VHSETGSRVRVKQQITNPFRGQAPQEAMAG